MLMRRRIASEGATPVFPDTNGGWRDPNLVMRWLRWSRDEAGFGWVTSHVFRQTVITVLDEAGLSTREVADQAGHSRIGQTQDYMARGIASERAAEVLEDLP
jgi:integrase